MADPAEVRAWARENGYDISSRGAIPEHITAAYNDADDARRTAAALGDDSGVTEADFPPAPEGDDLEPGSPAPRAPRAPRERKPRAVKPARKNWRQLWGSAQAKTKTKTGPRTDLSEFAEDTWRDLAMLSEGILPPVSRVLAIQAPYAGVVFDEAVRGVPFVDALLQPVARMSVSLRALNGLMGPAFFTAAITLNGGWQTTEDGKPVITPEGRPVPDQRTALMFGGLRYSLLQMSRTADLSKVQERAEADAERMRAVDKLVDFIFDFPVVKPQPGQQPPQAGQDGPRMPAPDRVLVPTMTYPPPPKMDDVGAA